MKQFFTIGFFLLFCCCMSSGELYAAEKVPEILQSLEMNPVLGTQISLDTEFQNEAGKKVKLGEYFDGKRPVALMMNYYGCPMLCGVIINAARDTFSELDWHPGKNFQIVTISINPHEDFSLAAAKKKALIRSVENPNWQKAVEDSWHFLVGPESSSTKIAKEIDFRYRWVPENKEYAHGAALYFFSPNGKLTRVLFGVIFNPRDVKLALLEASEGKIGTIAEKLLLFCYHYDPKGNKYAILARDLVKITAAVLVAIFLLVYGVLYWKKHKRGES